MLTKKIFALLTSGAILTVTSPAFAIATTTSISPIIGPNPSYGWDVLFGILWEIIKVILQHS